MERRFGFRNALVIFGLLVLGASGVAAREPVVPPAADGFPVQSNESWARPGVPVVSPGPWNFASDPSAAADFARGGTLTELFEGRTKTLTPFLANDAFSYRIVHECVCEPLAALDPVTLELRGVLAEKWQADPEGRWLRVKIRDEACFSDGAPVTGEDVRFTFMDFIQKQEINAGPFRSEASLIERIDVLSEKSLEFVFHSPRFNNLRAALRNSILPAHVYEVFTPDQINTSTALLAGSGPYRLESFDPLASWSADEELTLVRNERYWGARERTPAIDRLRFRFIPDNATRLLELEEGRGDVMRSTPEQHAARSADAGFAERFRPLAWTNMRSGYMILAWNCGERAGKPTPFADARVRRAMTLALDRERINRDFYEGLCEVATGPFPAWQADPAIKPLPFDLEAARQLLREAGWQDRDDDGVIENERGEPFEWELTSARGSVLGERVAPYIIDQCKRLGIRVQTRIVDAATLGALRSAHDFDALPTQWSWSDPEYDPFQTLHSSQIEQGDNWIQFAHSEADALMEEARRTVDPAARGELWRKIHRLVHEQQPCTYLLNIPWTRFVSTRIANVHTYPSGFDRREWYIPRDRQTSPAHSP